MKPIKNVILYSNQLPPAHIGGIETNAFYLAQMLRAESEYNVCVFTQGRRRFFWDASVRLMDHSDTKSKTLIIDKNRKRKFSYLKKCFLLSGFSPDETLIYHNTLDLHSHFSALNDLGFRQVARSGGNDIFYHQKKNADLRQAFLKNISFLDRLILNSDYSLERSISLGLDAKKLVVIKGGCEVGNNLGVPRDFEDDGLVPRIVTCGRLVDFKGLEDALDALSIVKRQGLSFRFYMIGDGPLAESLVVRIKALGLEGFCQILGKRPPSEIPSFYFHSNIYLSSSKDIVKSGDGYEYVHTETMGRSICEAQVHGVPVVSTDAGGAPEMLIDKVTGMVVPQGDVEEIAEAIAILLRDPDLLNSLSIAAKDFATKEFGWGKVFDETCMLFRSLEV